MKRVFSQLYGQCMEDYLHIKLSCVAQVLLKPGGGDCRRPDWRRSRDGGYRCRSTAHGPRGGSRLPSAPHPVPQPALQGWNRQRYTCRSVAAVNPVQPPRLPVCIAHNLALPCVKQQKKEIKKRRKKQTKHHNDNNSNNSKDNTIFFFPPLFVFFYKCAAKKSQNTAKRNSWSFERRDDFGEKWLFLFVKFNIVTQWRERLVILNWENDLVMTLSLSFLFFFLFYYYSVAFVLYLDSCDLFVGVSPLGIQVDTKHSLNI